MKIFESVSEMKLARLTAGQIVQTKGYYTAGDGGQAEYLIATAQAVDEFGDHTLANGNVALLQIPDKVSAPSYGVTNSALDCYDALQALIDRLSANGGGKIIGRTGDTYSCSTNPILKDDVMFDLAGAALELNLVGTSGFDYGLRLMNRAWIINGAINVNSTGSVATQGGIHAPINIGPLDGDGGTVGSPSDHLEVSGWGVHNMTLSTNRSGKNVISIKAGVNNGYIGNITIPDSANHKGIGADWGHVGDIDASDIPGSRTRFDGGTAYTLHPHNIICENIKCGEITNATATAVRLSGVHQFVVSNVEVEKCVGTPGANAAIFHTAGDVGYEFAPAEVKKVAHKGVVIENVDVKDADISWGVFVDCFADNVEAAVGGGYTPILPTIAKTDILLRHINTKTLQTVSALPGIRVQNIKGGRLELSSSKFHSVGILIEEGAQDFVVSECDPESNRQDGIVIDGPGAPPQRIHIEKCKPRLNGTDGTYSGIYLNSCADCFVKNNVLGDYDSETDQERGINTTNNCTGLTLEGNHVEDVSASNQAYKIGDANTSYGVLKSFKNNTWNSSKITTGVGGANLLTIDSALSQDGSNTIRTLRGQRAALAADTTPTAGAWINGDKIYYDDGPNGGFYGSICDVSGSPGTWTRLSV